MNVNLIEYQIGDETAWGTSAAATARLMGLDDNVNFEPGDEFMTLPEQRGSMVRAFNTMPVKRDGSVPMGGQVLYEDMPYWLDMLFGEATPSGSGTYTRDYAAPLGTEPTLRTSTVYKGIGANVYKLLGAIAGGLTISGQTGEPLMFQCPLLGKEIVTGALASLSDRAVNFAQADHIALYIDAVDGTIGATAITTTFFSFELAIDAGRAGKFGLGALTPKAIRESEFSGSLKLSMEFDATSKALVDAMLAGSGPIKKQIRIKSTKDADHVLQMDFAGTSPRVPTLFGNQDSVIALDFEFTHLYNTALGNWFKAQVLNQVATLP